MSSSRAEPMPGDTLSSLAPTPADTAGAETLQIMRAARRYNAWQYRRIAPYLGRRICEVGSGIGNISPYLLADRRELVLLSDTDPYYLETLRSRFGDRPDVSLEQLTLPDPAAAGRFQRYRLDTIVALNVLEHIKEDLAALASLAGMLEAGGRIVVMVPALPTLYGTLDRELGHVRRYTRAALENCMVRSGFTVRHLFYFNFLGAWGWWLNARVRCVPRIPLAQLRLFDTLVPLLQCEDRVSIPWGQSLIAIGVVV